MFGSRTLSLFALGLSAFAGFAQASPIAAATLTAGAPIITTKATTADLSIPIFTKFGSNVAAISSRIGMCTTPMLLYIGPDISLSALLDKQGLDLNDAFKSLFLEYDSAEAQLATLPVDSSKVRSAAHEQLIQTLTKAQLVCNNWLHFNCSVT